MADTGRHKKKGTGRLARGLASTDVLSFEDVTVGYGGEPALREITFGVGRGEVSGLVAIDGRGKSTLVKCAAGLLPPYDGTVRYDGRDVYAMSFREDQRFRRRSAVVFEGGALFSNRTIFANVALPLRYHAGGRDSDVASEVERLLERVGYSESLDAFPWQVSARGRRLAAFARALIREPELVIVDRFFEALDVLDSQRLMKLILELNMTNGTSFLLVGELAPTIFHVAERVLVLEGGTVLAYDFKPGLYKNARIKRAFEMGEEAMAAETAPRPLELGSSSDLLEMHTDPDDEPVVLVDEPEARRSRTPPRQPARPASGRKPPVKAPAPPVPAPASGGGDDPGEATVTLTPDAARLLLERALARRDKKIEEDASATERGESSRSRPPAVVPDETPSIPVKTLGEKPAPPAVVEGLEQIETARFGGSSEPGSEDVPTARFPPGSAAAAKKDKKDKERGADRPGPSRPREGS